MAWRGVAFRRTTKRCCCVRTSSTEAHGSTRNGAWITQCPPAICLANRWRNTSACHQSIHPPNHPSVHPSGQNTQDNDARTTTTTTTTKTQREADASTPQPFVQPTTAALASSKWATHSTPSASATSKQYWTSRPVPGPTTTTRSVWVFGLASALPWSSSRTRRHVPTSIRSWMYVHASATAE